MQSKWCLTCSICTINFCEYINNLLYLRTFLVVSDLLVTSLFHSPLSQIKNWASVWWNNLQMTHSWLLKALLSSPAIFPCLHNSWPLPSKTYPNWGERFYKKECNMVEKTILLHGLAALTSCFQGNLATSALSHEFYGNEFLGKVFSFSS